MLIGRTGSVDWWCVLTSATCTALTTGRARAAGALHALQLAAPTLSGPFVTPARQLKTLRDLGPASARRLRAVGIADHADLAEIGPASGSTRFDSTSLTLLRALSGALVDLDWRDLPAAERTRLRDEVERVRRSAAPSVYPRGRAFRE